MKRIPKPVWLALIPVVLGILVALFIRSAIAQPLKVTDNDMAPNLKTGQTVWLETKRHPRRFDVVLVAEHGLSQTTKKTHYTLLRVIGMPRDTVAYKGGKLYINGKQTKQSFLTSQQQAKGTSQFDWNLVSLSQSEGWISPAYSTQVPAGSYFLMGDNRDASNDSRHLGFISRRSIRGVVRLAPWSGLFKRHHNVNDAGA